MTHDRTRRVAATLTAGAVALLGTAAAVAPAHADTGGDVVTLTATDSPLSLEMSDRGDNDLSVSIERNTPGPVHDLKVTADLSGAPFVTASYAQAHGECTGEVCTVADDKTMTDKGDTADIELAVKDGTKPGTEGTVVFSGTSSDGTVNSVSATVIAGTPHIVVSPLPDHGTAAPGGTLDRTLYVADDGALPIHAERITLESSDGLDFGGYSNCTPVHSEDPLSAHKAVCDFATTIAAGRRYRLVMPKGVKVAATALNESFGYSAQILSTPPTGTGGPDALRLVKNGTPGGDWPSDTQEYVAVSNTADFAATGDTVSGRAGGSASLTVSVTNHGPASVQVLDSDDQMGVMVTVPKGTTTTKVPSSCYPWDIDGPGSGPRLGRAKYICDAPSPFEPNASVSLPFTVKIASDAPTVATGEVRATTMYGSTLDFDHDSADNTAPITVDVAGGVATPPASGGSGGSTGSTGSGTHTSGNAPAAQDLGSQPTGSLADTGFSGGDLAGLGGALLVAGGGAFLFARRARARSGRA